VKAGKRKPMKNLLSFVLTLCWSYWAQANFIETQVNQPIPDGDLSGLASTINLSGLSDPIGNLQVDMNISGTYNGDLYAYLTHGSGFVVLLNRVGSTASDNLGYGDGGMNVTFSASAPDIHDYRQTLFGNASTALSGPLTGTWGPDGRAVSPLSVTDADPRTSLLSSFQGQDANGQWTLFVADVSGGDLHQLNSWGLELNAPSASVPDSGNTAVLLLVGMAGVSLTAWCRRWAARVRRGSLSVKRSSFPSSHRSWLIGLALLMTCAGHVWAGPGGSVTGWGGQVEFPLNGYGAKFTGIAAGGYHNLAIKEDRTVVAWGENGVGDCDVPSGLSGVVAIAAGEAHSLALKADGTVVAWGDNENGQCDVPSGLSGVVAILIFAPEIRA
jgi:subtilisin-like proprotein convertase family protein